MNNFKDFMVFVWVLVFGSALVITACAPQVGPPGPAGQSIVGPVGANGTNCTVTPIAVDPIASPTGGGLVSCTDGTQVQIFNGAVGQQGVSGSNGSNGTNGTNGTNAESVVAVELCPSQGTPSYGNYPEYGYCIQGVLYALFEDNKGNLENTPLSSGPYTDAANNTTCTLTVTGCSVTQN